ncbi:hypothetical protein ABW02_20595 [Niallia circulans]|uniref:Serine protease n=1 Tax=Niallia circulans TaxID=1397 RepID=A0A0J1IAA0_NIACI|nr:S1C family serine protease [Niallia circulans]KLV22883.1 hypothetical protein ABW02_20595 [Niallia circulans]
MLLLSPRLMDLVNLPDVENDNGRLVSNSEGIKTQNISLNVDTDVTKAVDKAADSVVGITNLQSSNFWADETTAQEAGTGSGVIYKKSGDKAYIVTNNHVVQGATELEVTLSDALFFSPLHMIHNENFSKYFVCFFEKKEK